MKINNIEVSVLVGEKPIKLYGHNNKTFICANYGSEYSVKIKNNNNHRVMVVMSVDGIDVLNGKPANKNGVGYVINAYDSIIIRGFRKDNDTVGAFRFTKKKKGYAKEVTGSSENSGIIALAVFAERIYYTYNNSYSWSIPQKNCDFYKDSSAAPKVTFTCDTSNLVSESITASNLNSVNYSNTTTSTFLNCCDSIGKSPEYNSNILRSARKEAQPSQEVPDFKAATTWGTKLTDSVVSTTFEKNSSYPMAEFNIYYDVKESLEKIGIDFAPKKQVSYPKAFPQGFATPPVGWKS